MADRRTLDITRLGAQGDGVADTADGPLFVPLALPGERVVVDIERRSARLVEIVRASPDRAVPPCRHFGTCGGCVAQHMAPAPYQDWKREAVRAAFTHRGIDVTLAPTINVPPGTRRRAVLEARRAGGATTLGFHQEGSHALVAIDECPVLTPPIVVALPALSAIAAAAITREPGSARLTVTATRTGLAVDVTDLAGKPDALARARLAQLTERARIARLTIAGETIAETIAPKLALGGVEVALPPAAFTQATVEAEIAITALVDDALGKAKRAADLFCGLGTFTFALARRARVLAYDADAAAIAALTAAARAPGLKPIEARARDLLHEPLSRKELEAIDAVVFDPPRAGAKAQAEMLARAKVPLVVAVSCNPATLARDVRILIDGGYRLESVTPIDQFLWSDHIEAVAVLRR